MKSYKSILESICKTMVALGVITLVVGCGSSSKSPTGGGAMTSVYVIQNPAPLSAGSGTILQFSATATGSVAPVSTITAPANTSFNSLATDGSGNIYAATHLASGEDVRVYTAGAKGSATPVRILPGNATTQIGAVDGLAASAGGEIFVAEDSGGVAAFSATANGNVAPSRYILGDSQTGGSLSTVLIANAVAADSSDNLYILNLGIGPGLPIVVFGPTATGNVAPIRSIGGAMTMTTVGSLGGITTDSTGNLYVTNNTSTGSILVFGPSASGNVAPIRVISGTSTQLGALGGIKLDSVGNIYVVSTSATRTNPTVLKFSATASGNVAPTSSFTSSAWTNPDNALSLAVH